MAWSFSKSAGYRGYAQIGETALLTTGGQISVNQEPLTSTGVWGATPDVAAQTVAWAYNYLRVEGNISYELTKGAVWGAVKSFAFTARDSATNIIMKPDGGNGFEGEGYCSGVSFSCSEGQLVSGDINFIGDADADEGGITAEGESGAGGTSQYDNIFSGGGDVPGEGAVIAYWATGITGIDDVISWNCSYNSDIQLLKCCTGGKTGVKEPPVGADYVILGDMSGDGSYTIFTLKGDFAPAGMQNVKKTFNIKVGDAGLIKIPYALVSSGSTSMQTGSSYITADFNFTAIGNGKQGPIVME